MKTATDHTGQQAMLVDRGPCPLCGSSQRTLVHDFDQIPVVKCGSCGFMFASRVFTKEATERYYAHDWGSTWHRIGQRINAPVNLVALDHLVNWSKVCSMLDVGTGYGYLPALIKQRRGVPLVRGVEVSAAEARFARAELGVDVFHGKLDQANAPENAFDLVCSFEVIEHLLDPRAFLASMIRACKPGGTVVICTDNFDAPLVRAMGARFPKWIPHTHVSAFDAPSLRSLMRAEGLLPGPECSFTTWEIALRNLRTRFKKPVNVKEAWSFEAELHAEMNRAPKLPRLREWFNPRWFKLAMHRSAEVGALMFIAGTKPAT